MSNELLAIVQAEEQADSILEKAQRQKEKAIQEAERSRIERLQSFHPPTPQPVHVEPLRIDLDGLKRKAKKNKDAAVRKILEGIRAEA